MISLPTWIWLFSTSNPSAFWTVRLKGGFLSNGRLCESWVTRVARSVKFVSSRKFSAPAVNHPSGTMELVVLFDLLSTPTPIWYSWSDEFLILAQRVKIREVSLVHFSGM